MVLTWSPEAAGAERRHDVRRPERRWYSLYGHAVRSDVPLPVGPRPETAEEGPAWVFNLAGPGHVAPEPDGPVVAQQRCDHGAVNVAVHRSPGGIWFRHRSLATCHIVPGGRRVDVYPEPDAPDALLGLLLLGQVSTFVLHQLGHPSLHASAVLTERGTVVFLGPKGQGKSTMAAAFLRRGAALVTDDALPLAEDGDGVLALPGVPLVKLWPESARGTLAMAHELPRLAHDLEKRLLTVDGRFSFVDTSTRIRAIYVLDRYDPPAVGAADCRVRALGGRDGLAALIAQTSGGTFLQPAEIGRLLPLYARLAEQAPVRVLSYPSGFEHQAAVYAAVLADLEAQ
jgi:hypothetical protein